MKAFEQFFDYITTADNWSGKRGIWALLGAHVRISLLATVVAAGVAIPVALALGHIRRGGVLANALVNVGRAVPTFALISILYPISLSLDFQLGFVPTLVALVMLGIPPMFTNTYAGVVGVEPGIVEAARGMGMRPREVLWRVEAPNALPLIVAGLRVAAVQIAATATLGALVGYANLGSLIVESLTATRNRGPLLTGAVLVALLAILTEAVFGALERVVSPWRATGGRRFRRLTDVQFTKG